MIAGRRLSVVVMLTAISGACASADRSTLSARFIRHGTPSVDLGGPRPAAMRPADRHLLLAAAPVRRAPKPVVDSLESSDPELRAALASLLVAPTTAHHLDVAGAYVRRGVLDRAYDYLNRSLTINGADPGVFDALARLWRDWGRPGDGLGHAYRAAYLSPKSPIAQNTLGTLLYRLGRRDGARAAFAQALEFDPAAWYAMANLCYVNMAVGNTALAITQCRKANALRKQAGSPK